MRYLNVARFGNNKYYYTKLCPFQQQHWNCPVRDSAVNTSGTIFYKLIQILAYALDILAVKEAFVQIESVDCNLGQRVNEGRTKYGYMSSVNVSLNQTNSSTNLNNNNYVSKKIKDELVIKILWYMHKNSRCEKIHYFEIFH